jgi:hypothetical protein
MASLIHKTAFLSLFPWKQTRDLLVIFIYFSITFTAELHIKLLILTQLSIKVNPGWGAKPGYIGSFHLFFYHFAVVIQWLLIFTKLSLKMELFVTILYIVKRVSWFKSSLLLTINNKHTYKYYFLIKTN